MNFTGVFGRFRQLCLAHHVNAASRINMDGTMTLIVTVHTAERVEWDIAIDQFEDVIDALTCDVEANPDGVLVDLLLNKMYLLGFDGKKHERAEYIPPSTAAPEPIAPIPDPYALDREKFL